MRNQSDHEDGLYEIEVLKEKRKRSQDLHRNKHLAVFSVLEAIAATKCLKATKEQVLRGTINYIRQLEDQVNMIYGAQLSSIVQVFCESMEKSEKSDHHF